MNGPHQAPTERGSVRRVTVGRASAVVVAVGLVAAALTGCSSNPNDDCVKPLPSGSAASLVKATGKIGAKPKITAPTPIDAAKSQRSVLTEGRGTTVHLGQQVELGFTVLDGKTGDVLGSGYGDQGAVVSVGSDVISRGLMCTTVGSRVAIAVAAKDAQQSGGSADSGTQIYVLDVVDTSLNAANGAVRPSVSGFPTVVLAPTGQPGVTIPSSSKAPTKVRSEVLKQGDGAVVKKDSTAVLQYTAVGWDSKQVVTSSWTNGGPDRVNMATGQSQIQGQSSALPQSMLKELVGQKVGSQLVIETPEEGQVPAAAWVVDILGIR